MEWLYLTGAIVCEVGATLSLRAATTGSRRWYVPSRWATSRPSCS